MELENMSRLVGRSRARQAFRLTVLARRLFGQFVPMLVYPSPSDIERDLSNLIRFAALQVASANQTILEQAFIEAFAALERPSSTSDATPESILEAIKRLLSELQETELGGNAGSESDVYGRLDSLVRSLHLGQESPSTATNVLNVYKKSLEQRIRAQRESFASIASYVASVNEFLEGKHMIILPPEKGPAYSMVGRLAPSLVSIKFDDGSACQLRALSSGERQILTMIYAAAYSTAGQGVVLIDEPELSLHIDWQRSLINKMAHQLGKTRQLIVCTHSPEVGADYGDRYQELSPRIVPVGSRGTMVDHDPQQETDEEALQ